MKPLQRNRIFHFVMLFLLVAMFVSCSSPETSENARESIQSSNTNGTSSLEKTDVSDDDGPEEIEQREIQMSDSTLEIHFLDVGQGDATLLICDGEAMLVDGGAPDKSDLIYTYLKNHNIRALRYIIATHPDADHVGGLSGALNYAKAEIALSAVSTFDSKAFTDFTKYLGQQGVDITIPENGQRFNLGKASFTIVSPKEEYDSNNSSLVLRVEHGSNSILLTGDAEVEEEKRILADGAKLNSDVMKVGHHGSETSTSDEFLTAVAPVYAVISVGKNNPYFHPAVSVLSKLKQAGIQLFRTDINGDIICVSDGEKLTFELEKNSDQDTFATPEPAPIPIMTSESDGNSDFDKEQQDGEHTETQSAGTDYVVNTNTGKFHYPNCSSVKKMKDKNKMFFNGTRDELISRGYSPCGNCHP